MKWDYTIISVSRITSEMVKDFYGLGKDEWELVSVDNGIAYFKRPKIERGKQEYLYSYDTQDGYTVYKGDEKIEPWDVARLLNEGKVD